ncbi:DNA primase [Streptomyces griseosporeus]|uniref:DNA primase n=1 Tax=Streptomyces griseosporeus TaxID=1910 RepID=UPI003701566A
MNRVGLGLAVGAGYVLGRTKKAKLAFAVGSLVAGKRMNLSPRAVAELVNRQLKDNPQFKEIGEELRTDLRGVGKAASGALVERQIGALADRLHSRTGQVREQLAGGPARGGKDDEEDTAAEDDSREEPDEAADDEPEEQDESEGGASARKPPAKKAPAKKAAAKKTAPAKKAARKAPGAGAARKTASAGKKTAKSASSGRRAKGGGE